MVFEHLLRDVTGNVHDGLVTGSAFGQLRNERVSVSSTFNRSKGVRHSTQFDGGMPLTLIAVHCVGKVLKHCLDISGLDLDTASIFKGN